jgi:hypothetical protein
MAHIVYVVAMLIDATERSTCTSAAKTYAEMQAIRLTVVNVAVVEVVIVSINKHACLLGSDELATALQRRRYDIQ